MILLVAIAAFLLVLFWACQQIPNIGDDQIHISRDDRDDPDAR